MHTLTIKDPNNALALSVFLAVAMLVSSVVDLAARRTRQAARAAAESDTLANLASAVLTEGDALGLMLDRLRETFALRSVTLFERRGERWQLLASSGSPCASPDAAETVVPAGERRVIALQGQLLEADDQRVVTAFGTQVAVVLDRMSLRAQAAEADGLAQIDRTRTALLAAVGHDLRTPLAAAKASLSTLRSVDLDLSVSDRDELVATADESLDRLAALIENLLDMSRLQAGALAVETRQVAVEEIAARALDDLRDEGRRVLVDIPQHLPTVLADPGLLERVLVNLVANALRFAPDDRPPRLAAARLGQHVEVRVIDQGPGIPDDQRDQVFLPFQRLGDTDNTTGVGLGLALSRGLTEAMGGTLEAEDTPAGGLTMVVRLQAGEEPESAPEPGLRERGQASAPGRQVVR